MTATGKHDTAQVLIVGGTPAGALLVIPRASAAPVAAPAGTSCAPEAIAAQPSSSGCPARRPSAAAIRACPSALLMQCWTLNAPTGWCSASGASAPYPNHPPGLRQRPVRAAR